VPLKLLTFSVRVVPFEPRLEPPYAEPLLVQVEEGLAMATVVEESAMPPPLVATVIIEEERMVTETIAPKRHWSHRPGPARVVKTW
jgi:hypothetical protein